VYTVELMLLIKEDPRKEIRRVLSFELTGPGAFGIYSQDLSLDTEYN